MSRMSCINPNFYPNLEDTTANQLYIKIEQLKEQGVIPTKYTNEGVVFDNNQLVSISDLLLNDNPISNASKPPYFDYTEFIPQSEYNIYENRKAKLREFMEELGVTDIDVYEDLPLKVLIDKLEYKDNLDLGRVLRLHNTIPNPDMTLGQYLEERLAYVDTPDMLYKDSDIDSFEDYLLLNHNIPNNNWQLFSNLYEKEKQSYLERILEPIHKYGLRVLLTNLKNRTGIDFKFVNTNNFKARIQYGKIEIANNTSKEDVFHEYLHPFVLAIQQDNPTLYNNLINIPDLQQDIAYYKQTNEYNTYAEEEALVRYMANNADISIVRQFYNWLKSFIKGLLGIKKTVSLDKLDVNTTIQELIDILVDADMIDINSDHYVLHTRYNTTPTTTTQAELVATIKGFSKFDLKYVMLDNDGKETGNILDKEPLSGSYTSFYLKDGDRENRYKRASDYVDGKPIILTEEQKVVGAASSNVGTLFHNIMELVQKLNKEGSDTFLSDSKWNKFKASHNIPVIYLDGKPYIQYNGSITIKEVRGNNIRNVTYTFEEFNNGDISKIQELSEAIDRRDVAEVEKIMFDNYTNMIERTTGIKLEYKTKKEYQADLEYLTKNIKLETNAAQRIDVIEGVLRLMDISTTGAEKIASRKDNFIHKFITNLNKVKVQVKGYNPYYTSPTLNNYSLVNVLSSKDSKELLDLIKKFIIAKDGLDYFDSANFAKYTDAILEVARGLYVNIYETYGINAVIIPEIIIGTELRENNDLVAGTIDALVIGEKGEVGILDYKTIGVNLFKELLNPNITQRKQVAKVIEKYGDKQYLYQEMLAKLLTGTGVTLDSISNALMLVTMRREFVFSDEVILQYLKEVIKPDKNDVTAEFAELLEGLSQIDTGLTEEDFKSWIHSEDVTILKENKVTAQNAINNKLSNKGVKVLGAINSYMLKKRAAIYKEIKSLSENSELTSTDIGILVDKEFGYKPTKVVIKKPKFNKDNVRLVPIYYNKHVNTSASKYTVYLSMLRYYINYIERYKATNKSMLANPENKYLNELIDNSLAKLKKNLVLMTEDFNIKELTSDIDYLAKIQQTFQTTDYNVIISLIHNLGNVEVNTNAMLNKQQVFNRQTFAFSAYMKNVLEKYKNNKILKENERDGLIRQHDRLLTDINNKKKVNDKYTLTDTGNGNMVVVYEDNSINIDNNNLGAIKTAIEKLDHSIKDYTNTILAIETAIEKLHAIYVQGIQDFNANQMFVEVSDIFDITEQLVKDLESPIDANNYQQDVNARVAKFEFIEKAINVYGSFAQMFNTLSETVIIGDTEVKVNQSVRDYGVDILESIKNTNPELYDKINTITLQFNKTLRDRANIAYKRFIADIITTNSSKDDKAYRENVLWLKTNIDGIVNMMNDDKLIHEEKLFKSYLAKIEITETGESKELFEELMVAFRNQDNNSVKALLQKKSNDILEGYIENRNKWNTEEFERLSQELSRGKLVNIDNVFKFMNESFLGASKSTYRIVQLLAILNTKIEDNYVSLFANMVNELESITAKTLPLLPSQQSKYLNILGVDKHYDFDMFIANAVDEEMSEEYLIKHYEMIFDEEDINSFKISNAPIQSFIQQNNLVNKYSIVKTNTLIDRFKWGIRNSFKLLLSTLRDFNHKESPQGEYIYFSRTLNAQERERKLKNHNNNKKEVMKAYLDKHTDTYYIFDYRKYFLTEYIKDLHHYHHSNQDYIDDVNKELNVDDTTNIDELMQQYRVEIRNDLIAQYKDEEYVDLLLEEVTEKYHRYKKVDGVESGLVLKAKLRKEAEIEQALKKYNIAYDKNELNGEYIHSGKQGTIAMFDKIIDEAALNEATYIKSLYTQYSPFSYSEQMLYYKDGSFPEYYDEVFKTGDYYKISNLSGSNVVFIPLNKAENIDTRFDTILVNKDLKSYYYYLRQAIKHLHSLIPYEIRNNHNQLELPAIDIDIITKVMAANNIKDLKLLTNKSMLDIIRENITSIIPANYDEPHANITTLTNNDTNDLLVLRRKTRKLTNQLDKTIQLFMFETLLFKTRYEMYPLHHLILKLSKYSNNDQLRESVDFNYIQNMIGSKVRNIKEDKPNITLTEEAKQEVELLHKKIIDLQETLRMLKREQDAITSTPAYWEVPKLLLDYYELIAKSKIVNRQINSYYNEIKTIYRKGAIDVHTIERNLITPVKLVGLSYNLIGQVNNLLMGFIQTKNRAMSNKAEREAYLEAFELMDKIITPEKLMTLAGITSNQLIDMLIPIPVVGKLAGFVGQMITMAYVGSTIDSRASTLFSDNMLSKVALTSDMIKVINMNTNYNFTNDITEEGRAGQARPRLTVDMNGKVIDTKNQFMNLLKPYSFIKRAELFVAMFSMLIQAKLMKIKVGDKEYSLFDIHDDNGNIKSEFIPYISDTTINLFKRKTLDRMTDASGNYREKTQIEKYPAATASTLYMKWIWQPVHHIFHRTTNASDNVYSGQDTATSGTAISFVNQIQKTYLKIVRNSVLMDKKLSALALTIVDNVDVTLDELTSTPTNSKRFEQFINRFGKNISANFNNRIVLYDKGFIVHNSPIIVNFIKERRAVLDKYNNDEEGIAKMEEALEFILNKPEYKNIRLLKESTKEDRLDTTKKLSKLILSLLNPVNTIPKSVSYKGKSLNSTTNEILDKHYDKNMEQFDEYEKAHYEGLQRFTSSIHTWISWTYYSMLSKILYSLIIGLFDLDREDEVYKIMQSFDNRFNRLYQDVIFFNTGNPTTMFINNPYKIFNSTFGTWKFYYNKVLPVLTDMEALPLYTLSEVATTDESVMEDVLEGIYKNAGLKHPYVDDPRGDFTNYRLVNDAIDIIPLANKLQQWEKSEQYEQQSN